MSFPAEPHLFREICSSKHAQDGLGHYLEAIRFCAGLGKQGPRHEPWATNGEIIAGLELPESSIRAPPTRSTPRWLLHVAQPLLLVT